MTDIREDVVHWLENVDESCKLDRLKRLEWIVDKYPNIEIQVFHGGTMSPLLFEETRYCFIYGQFLSCILLGLAFIERFVGALLFASGTDDFKRAGLLKMLDECTKRNWMTEEMFKSIAKINDIKNSVAHFREPMHEDVIDVRIVKENKLLSDILKEDAQKVIETVFHFVSTYGAIY